MTNKTILGIDPGLTGALAFYNKAKCKELEKSGIVCKINKVEVRERVG